MKYDKFELKRLNITEEGIQRQRDNILKGLTEGNLKYYCFIIHPVWLPFIIDMLDDYKFFCEPFGLVEEIKITVTLR